MGKIIKNEKREPKFIAGKPKSTNNGQVQERTPVQPLEDATPPSLTLQSLVNGYSRIIDELVKIREHNEVLTAQVARMNRDLSMVTGDVVRLTSVNNDEHKFLMVRFQEGMLAVPDIVNEQVTTIFDALQNQQQDDTDIEGEASFDEDSDNDNDLPEESGSSDDEIYERPEPA
jgi:hypothetical protein